MKASTILAATAVIVASTLSAQAQCFRDHDQQVMSCAEGTTWDADAKTCVPQTTS